MKMKTQLTQSKSFKRCQVFKRIYQPELFQSCFHLDTIASTSLTPNPLKLTLAIVCKPKLSAMIYYTIRRVNRCD